MLIEHLELEGLNDAAVAASAQKHGYNRMAFKKQNKFLGFLTGLLKEPMIVLLFIAAAIYLVSGNYGDSLFMVAAIIMVAVISIYQDTRSRVALEKLQQYIHPKSKVIRNGAVQELDSGDLVVGDQVIVEEGTYIPADGVILSSNDFSVNESILTGESLHVSKDLTEGKNKVFGGTIVTSGLAIIEITAVGNNTELGKIGKSLESIEQGKTPLEKQISHFVKMMVLIGAVIFVIVWIINYSLSRDILDSLLKALTLAMSILPEEIPVAFTTFMALGAWRLMKMGIVVKQMKTVETLGSATVICTDKTGTLTENKMQLSRIYSFSNDEVTEPNGKLPDDGKALIRTAMWASEPIPFDPMEMALHDKYREYFDVDERPAFKMIHEYPIEGKPPMMTHIFENDASKRIIAAKGAPEAIVRISDLSEGEKDRVHEVVHDLATEGYRVLGVGSTEYPGDNFPEKQQEFKFNFEGLVAFHDPPKKNINKVLNDFYDAGIQVKIITGDNAGTTRAIARQIGFRGADRHLQGESLMLMDEPTLEEKVEEIQIFSRMFPEAKLRIINALKERNEIVAMTGDGVNDGPALKAAHIGVAMGKKGSEIAKSAASIILADDDLSKMVDAVAMGRKIYTNLKKAIQYIISIHIPIILTVFLPLALGWIYPNIFTPVHVIFLELIMGPTCSIIYENEPMEPNLMVQPPRPLTSTFFNSKELITSIIQGLMITAGTLLVYQFAVSKGWNEDLTRTMVFTTLISSNVFLTLVNRSFYYSVIRTLFYKNSLVPLIIGVTIAITLLLIYVDPLTGFFKFEHLNLYQLGVSVLVGFVFVIWFEIVKAVKRFRFPTKGEK
jgi:Ca2+-transporting ATPase